jgi:hypothetical protein
LFYKVISGWLSSVYAISIITPNCRVETTYVISLLEVQLWYVMILKSLWNFVNKYSMNVKAKYLDASSLTLYICTFSYAQ